MTENHHDNSISSICVAPICLHTSTNLLYYFRRASPRIALTIARSSSNSRQPAPSNLSRSMRPFHRTHTPFIMKCDSMWTCVGKDKSISINHVSKLKKYSKYVSEDKKKNIPFKRKVYFYLNGSVHKTFAIFVRTRKTCIFHRRFDDALFDVKILFEQNTRRFNKTNNN